MGAQPMLEGPQKRYPTPRLLLVGSQILASEPQAERMRTQASSGMGTCEKVIGWCCQTRSLDVERLVLPPITYPRKWMAGVAMHDFET